ncbi:MAG TPA: hypothetical protein VHW04_04490 [Solirubrobacteraceae bacterium]|jgi:hypothetical protein|nr:hypothetical protein [Solirubrobacteraceae bacterium]
MSPRLQAEIMSARQQEMTASAVDPDDLREPHDAGSAPHLSARYPVRRVVTRAAAAAVCLGVATIVATGGPSATAMSFPVGAAATQALSPTAPHLQRSIRALESNGYVAKACTPKGMLMANPLTGRATTITY